MRLFLEQLEHRLMPSNPITTIAGTRSGGCSGDGGEEDLIPVDPMLYIGFRQLPARGFCPVALTLDFFAVGKDFSGCQWTKEPPNTMLAKGRGVHRAGEAIINGERVELGGGTLLLIERGDKHETRNTDKQPLKTLNEYVPSAYTDEAEELPARRG